MPIAVRASLSPPALLLVTALTMVTGLGITIESGQIHADESTPVSTPRDVQRMFEQLGADEFSVRERAAAGLVELGISVVPELRKLTEATADPEVRLRGNEIIQKLTDGDMAGQIADFLAGQHVEFAGWRRTRAVLGDSIAIRQMFVKLMQEHPDIAKSLEQTTRDRVITLDKTLSSIEHKMFKQRKTPTQADAFAMLLPITDPDLPISERFAPIAFSVLRKEAATKIQDDAQLSGPFKSLLGWWIERSSEEHRDGVLEFAMLWDLEDGMPVAVQTLQETHEPETLAFAMQTIARFGGRQQIEYILPFLEDRSVVIEQGFVRGKEVQTLLCDVALVTIARLYNVDLPKLGYPNSVDDPTFSFRIEEIGFGKDEPNLRKATRAKIDERLKKNPPLPVPKPNLPALR